MELVGQNINIRSGLAAKEVGECGTITERVPEDRTQKVGGRYLENMKEKVVAMKTQREKATQEETHVIEANDVNQ